MEGYMPEIEYTVIMDVDGDDLDGPLTMQAKFYPADTDEPAEYTESWLTSLGLQSSEDEEFDHLILIGGFRAGDVAPGPALEISNLSICVSSTTRQIRRVSAVTASGRSTKVATALYGSAPTAAGSSAPIPKADDLLTTVTTRKTRRA